MPLSERQKVWVRVIRFTFSDTLLSVLNHQQTITDQERDRLSRQLEERCSLPPNSIFAFQTKWNDSQPCRYIRL